jgi:hypothetical protein
VRGVAVLGETAPAKAVALEGRQLRPLPVTLEVAAAAELDSDVGWFRRGKAEAQPGFAGGVEERLAGPYP